MLVSHSHNFIFIHVDKTAGSSFTAALEQYADRDSRSIFRRRLSLLGSVNRWTGLHRFVQFGVHERAERVRACLPVDFWEKSFKFAIVRNPWDRLASRYRFVRANKEHRHSVRVSEMRDFAEYARWEMRSLRPMVHQHEFVCADGKIIVDFIGRFERLAADFSLICERVGIHGSLGHLNSTEQRDFRSYYDDALAEEVGRFYETDVKMFGYSFDGHAGEA